MTLPCPTCGVTIDLPAGFDRPKVRCDGCGYYAPVPEALRNRAPQYDDIDLSDDPPPPRPDPSVQPSRPGVARPLKPLPPAADTPLGPPLLSGSEHEEDVPYTVPGDGTKKCPECRKKLPLDAVFCVHCGLDMETDRIVKRREFQSVDKVWESRWPLTLRLQVFAGLVVFNVLMTGVLFLLKWPVVGGLFVLAFQIAVQAVALGSFETVWARRTAKGLFTVHKRWRLAFIPQGKGRVEWERHQGIGIVATGESNGLEWFTFLYLFFCTGIVPAVIFFWFVMRPARYAVAFCDAYGAVNDTLFRTTDRLVAEEVAETVADCGGLTYKPVL
jgi:Uncharacterised protein family UPF0547